MMYRIMNSGGDDDGDDDGDGEDGSFSERFRYDRWKGKKWMCGKLKW